LSFAPQRDRKKNMHICQKFLSGADYLERRGFTRSQFSRLHHHSLAGRPFNLNATREYFNENKKLRGTNRTFAERVIFVANTHRWNEGNFEPIINRALEKWPLIA
jgi:hypothetical protein